eukprot:TRINITY_DN828_c0_g1_i6.p1 TRINITY_DN828_c0_g1~~TRINITY_DN828_c0_g1_i6.p1  ORF type:complete len:206 (-),score=24.43 TRINITY_DN828_c0_g1_i6:82-639(-)
MRILILVAIISITLVFSQPVPVLSDNFAALVDALIDDRVVNRVHVWEDYDDQKTRFDFERGPVQVHRYHFYKLRKTYEVELHSQNCTVIPLTTTLQPAFGWVLNATHDKNPCYSNIERGRIGDEWSYATSTYSLYLCVDRADVNRPLWLESVSAKDMIRNYFQFHSYFPGVPKPEIFELPPFCSK